MERAKKAVVPPLWNVLSFYLSECLASPEALLAQSDKY